MIVFDLEGTISIHKNRLKYLPDYDKFHEHFPEDELYLPIAEKISNNNGLIMILTGMMQKHRIVAEKWLKKNNVRYTFLIMRANNDLDPSPLYKVKRLLDWRDNMGFKITDVYDDRKDIIDMINQFEFNGILVEQNI